MEIKQRMMLCFQAHSSISIVKQMQIWRAKDAKLIKEGKRKLARKFILPYRYTDDLISFNDKRFNEFISDIYPQRTHNF